MSAHEPDPARATSSTPPAPRASPEPERDAADAPTTWLNKGERGTLLGVRIAFAMATLFGRTATRLLVRVVALWYRIFDRRAVRASRDWLTRVHGERPGWWAVYRHIVRFAQVTMDRIFILEGKTRALTFTRTGDHHIKALAREGRGAVLLGAHLGSYEAMRLGGVEDQARINILGYFENARMINALIERLDPEAAARVIHIGTDPIGVMSRVRERVAHGELVAMLGDRVGLSDRTVHARFFGEEAPFSAGPFLLAALLRCPVYLVFGLYSEPNRYDLYCEPFAESVTLPRAHREETLRALVQRYADRLEHYARRAPDNWFNFFDFWRSP